MNIDEININTDTLEKRPYNKLNKEQKRNIDNQVKILLKGVAESSSLEDIQDKLAEKFLSETPLRIKLGLDPSAPDIHLGHTVVLRKIRQLQDLGNTAVIIIGDYTGMIGDPTGKSKTRKQLSHEEVQKNAETYLNQIFKILKKDQTEVHYNSEWLSKLNFKDVIELASKVTVARMLERDDFNNRYTNHLPLSIHELFYPLMQAYDSVAIKADIELGGTDQTFNILMGRNIQRDYNQSPQITLFMPLLEGIDGVEKMSKSLGNYIGIDEDPIIMYEKVMKIPDNFIIKYYELCTDQHPDYIEKIKNRLDNGENPRDLKMILAYDITSLYHGEEEAEKAQEHFKKIFQKNQIPEDALEIPFNPLLEISIGDQIINFLFDNKVYASKSEARRIFQQGGARINNKRVLDFKNINLVENEAILKMGKKRFFKLVAESN